METVNTGPVTGATPPEIILTACDAVATLVFAELYPSTIKVVATLAEVVSFRLTAYCPPLIVTVPKDVPSFKLNATYEISDDAVPLTKDETPEVQEDAVETVTDEEVVGWLIIIVFVVELKIVVEVVSYPSTLIRNDPAVLSEKVEEYEVLVGYIVEIEAHCLRF